MAEPSHMTARTASELGCRMGCPYGIASKSVQFGHREAKPALSWVRLDPAPMLSHVVAMAANTIVRARIDEETRNEAAAVLAAMGLTVSDAFRMLLIRIAREKALPFEPLVPNEETIEAMRAARRGELVTVGSPEDLLADLNADC